MRCFNLLQRSLVIALCAVLGIGVASTALAADPPVKVTVAVTGDPQPGATVTAKATVAITDGSTVQSIKWTQTAGVAATLANATTDTVSVTLPALPKFKEAMLEVLEEMPAATFPAYVPKPQAFEAGLQNRFVVTALTAHAVNDAAAIPLSVSVVTSSGTYKATGTVTAKIPYQISTGNRNVPALVPALLHGKKQASYDWTLTTPPGSTAKLADATTQNPEFTPDVPGRYDVTVTDLATNKPVTISVTAGLWKGMIAGQTADGRPVPDSTCTGCHVKNTPHFDLFTPWAKTGHAEIFTQNVSAAGHYSASCLGCHTVGYNSNGVKNNGIDDQSDFSGLLASGLIEHGDPLNWTKILTQFPNSARFANIQCENCHGPQDSNAHGQHDGARATLSSDLCGTCHGEPPRHGRFQQWQLSGHANYELATEEGTDATCGKCHSAQGYIQWQDNNFSDAALKVTWTTEDVQPQSCQTCHDPHDIGTTSGDANTNAKVRVSGSTPMLMAGFVANDVGRGATCMTCHNGRRGLRNDSNFQLSDGTRAPHAGPQADILMGQNLYFVKVGTPSFHSTVADSCVNCHMEKTAAPLGISLAGVGTNHTFYADRNMCSGCHTSAITADKVQGQVTAKMAALKTQIESAIKGTMQAQIRAGNAIDIGGKKTVKVAADIAKVEFIESHGRQGVSVTLANGTAITDLSLQSVKVVRPTGAAVELYAVTDPAVAKAGWNYFMVNSDASKGVHNPGFINSALDIATYAVQAVNTNLNSGNATPGGNAAIGGGIGNGAGAVACTSPYVYWAEVVGHAPGVGGSQWRSDVVARNLGSSNAALRFVFHQAGGNLEAPATINGGAQKAFEDIVATLGGTNNIGPLEICSDQPLLVSGRTFNLASAGTFGQNFDGGVADLGYSAGQTVSLIGLRQKSQTYRTNVTVTNGGTTEAQVAITLFDASGNSLKTYNVTVPAGLTVMENEPFANRASVPDIDWGFATVTVLKGTNIRTSASVIDFRTNDPTTIPPKQ